MRWSFDQVSSVLKKSVGVFVLTTLIIGIVPVHATPTPIDQTGAELAMVEVLAPVEDLSTVEELPSVEAVLSQLEARFETLKDLRAIVKLRDATRLIDNEAEIELQAVAPSVVRVTFRRPDLVRGSVYVLDYAANEVYEYNPVLDLAQCLRRDQFIARWPSLAGIMQGIESLFAIPNGGDLGDIDVIGLDTIDGREHVVLRIQHSEQVEQVIEEGLDVIEGTLRTAGFPIDVGDTKTLYVWVDMAQPSIRQIKEFTSDDELRAVAEMTDWRMDQGLTATTLKSFPRGVEIRRCR